MNYQSLKPDPLALQTTVIDWLKSVSEFNETISIVLGKNGQTNKDNSKQYDYEEFKKLIDNQLKKVEKMELVMAIAAPMKAGKSTIINALIGMDLLPNRATAMTTLPTEVVFGEEKEPTLTLSDETLSIFQNKWNELRIRFNNSNSSKIDNAQKEIKQYPYLDELLKEIQKLERLPISKETSGSKNLMKGLTTLNDMVRFCNLIEESPNPLLNLPDLPRVQTSLWGLLKTENLEDGIRLPIRGNLVIVDTPGPNESRQNGLAQVVIDQLEKSAMVLLVLDFTGLSNQAAEEIKQNVKKTIDDLGSENLYVLVNKIDQRKESTDMNSEQLHQFVVDNLELFNKSTDIKIKDRVFECSAKRAFFAANFIQQLQQTQAVKISEMSAADDFCEEMGTEYSGNPQKRKKLKEFLYIYDEAEQMEKLNPQTKEKLQNFAKELWENSGFESFLKKAIKILVKITMSKLIKGATLRTKSNLNKIYEYCKNRSIYAEEEVNKIQNGIQSIDIELSKIDRTKLHLNQEAENTIKTLQIAIEKEFNIMLAQSLSAIQQHLNESFYDDYLAREREQILSNKTPNTQESKFNNKEDANNFFTEVYQEEVNYFQNLCFRLRDTIERQIEEEVHKLINSIESKIQPIIENTWNELRKNFGDNLSFSSPDIKNIMDEIIAYNRNHDIILEDQTFEERTVKRWTWWRRLFFIGPKEETITIPKDDIYIVKKKDISDILNKEVKNNTLSIRTELNKVISEYFKDKMGFVINETRKCLIREQKTLKQAIEDKKKNESEQNKLIDKLNNLQEQIFQEIKRAEVYEKYAQDLESRMMTE